MMYLLFFSLQFLSMKLATVNPELNLDLERLLPTDVSYSSNINWEIIQSIMIWYSGSNMNPYSPSYIDSSFTRWKCCSSRFWSRDKLLSHFLPWYLSGNIFRHPKYKSTIPSFASGIKGCQKIILSHLLLIKILIQRISVDYRLY